MTFAFIPSHLSISSADKNIMWLAQRVHVFRVAACRCPSTRVLQSRSDGFWSQTPGSSFKDKHSGFHSDLGNHLQLFRDCCTHTENTHKASLQQSCWNPPIKHQAGAHFCSQVYVQEPYRFQWEPTQFLKRISINNFSMYRVEKLKLLKPQSWRGWL